MVEKKCKCCGRPFYVKKYRENTALYCSKSCSSKANYDKQLRYISHDYAKGNQYRKGLRPTNSFEKGHIPWNKGIKGIHLSKESEFQKGRTSLTKCPIGTIKERNEKGKIRNFIKIAQPNKWEYYYVYLWKQKNGEIPKGCVIHHINKIPNDDRIENLICLTRAEHINIHRQDLFGDDNEN